MLRVVTLSQDQFDYLWAKIMPMSRRSVDWIGADSCVLSDSEGPILVTTARVETGGHPLPDRVLKFLKGFETKTED